MPALPFARLLVKNLEELFERWILFSHIICLVVQPFYWAIAISQCRISICVTWLLSVVHVLPFSGALSYLSFTVFFVYSLISPYIA